MIDIERLLPEYITAKLWDYSFIWERVDKKYLIKEVVNNDITVDKVEIYVEDRLIDTINKDITLKAWDTLHLEYEINVCEVSEQYL